ncbi:glycosyltransferase [Streptomyces sp. NPDC088354]|uniref:glycosyltransferase n=1 Tax=unclassified Streptomyces TaxID=2593676 RepID=UPI0029AB096D|nr:glycosyltransferase [Streptomyces sp. MI02-7b]MDX3070992.1 glycosyltransferase [Streptomyces sp. MI02-7b]
MSRRSTADSMAIALVSEHASPLTPPGGPDGDGPHVHVVRLAVALAERGHRVTVHIRRDAPGLPDVVPLCEGVEVHHVAAGPACPLTDEELLPHMPEFGRHLTRVWRIRQPDIVHTHFWMTGLASLRAAGLLGIPLVHTFHVLGTVTRRYEATFGGRPADRVVRETEVALACDRVIAVCRDEVGELALMGVPAHKISVVPRGVDTERFTPLGLAAQRGPAPYRLLQVGAMAPRKGIAVSVAALTRLPDTELVVVGGPAASRLGDDPEVRRLLDLARDMGVADRVRFTGAVPGAAVAPLIRSADVVVAPADYEPFGSVPLEAMACGRPVVASAVGGHLDTVADPGTGRLVAPHSHAALAHAVGGLLAAPGTRRVCGINGRRRALTRFAWPRVAAMTEQVYQGVLVPDEVALAVTLV